MDDEVPAAVKQEVGPSRWAACPHAARVRCLYMLIASTALVEKGWMWSAAKANAMALARASTSEGISSKALTTGTGTLELHNSISMAIVPSASLGVPTLRLAFSVR